MNVLVVAKRFAVKHSLTRHALGYDPDGEKMKIRVKTSQEKSILPSYLSGISLLSRKSLNGIGLNSDNTSSQLNIRLYCVALRGRVFPALGESPLKLVKPK